MGPLYPEVGVRARVDMLAPVRFAALLSSCVLAACTGPEAPDVDVCRDLIDRLCAAPVCSSVGTAFQVGDDGCVARLRAQSGCGDDGFAFTQPTRSRALECRLPLVRSSSAQGAHPDCLDVDETLRICPDLVSFLGGTP